MGANAIFARMMRKALPERDVLLPAPGELVTI